MGGIFGDDPGVDVYMSEILDLMTAMVHAKIGRYLVLVFGLL